MSQPVNIKKQILLGIDGDSSPKTVDNKAAINIMNARKGITELGRNNRLESAMGTIEITSWGALLPTVGTNFSLGSVTDAKRDRIIGFNWNSNGNHGIYCYDKSAGVAYTVLLNSQVKGGLLFSKSFRINRNARVVGDLLIFTDNQVDIRSINIESAIKLNLPAYNTSVDAYTAPLDYTDITLIRRPPILRLQISKKADGGFNNNFIEVNTYQFTYRYQYKDYTYSVLAVYSQLVPQNYAGDTTSNYVNVSLPFGEIIPDYVLKVDIIARYGNSGKSFIIKSFSKVNQTDLSAINAHNANTTALNYSFYDNTSGYAVDDVTANTPFDNLALTAETLEYAVFRLFVGNLLKGYTTPSLTSLALAQGNYNTAGAGTFVAQWKYFNLTAVNTSDGVTTSQVTFYYAFISGNNPSSFYYSGTQTATPPAQLTSSSATVSDAVEVNIGGWVIRNVAPPAGMAWSQSSPFVFVDTGARLNIVFTLNLNGLQFFKSSSTYRVSLAFYDRYRRKTGVVRTQEIAVPQRTATQSVFAANIQWTLTNGTAAALQAEIPSWAYYYQIHISKNLVTRNFIQIKVLNTDYINKNARNTYDYGQSSFTLNTTYAVGFDLTPLTSRGIGYTFNDGDYVRVFKSNGSNVLLRILGQDGNFILTSPTDLGTLGAGYPYLIEIFTPYIAVDNEPLFETGDMMYIANPTLSNRSYAVTSGTINGDCYALQRDDAGGAFYFVEAMSPNDKAWKVWQTDRGWPNFIDAIGQQTKTNDFDFSDTYIAGTKTNGLNKFQPLNTKTINVEAGKLRKFQNATKVTEQGGVLLAICEENPVSIYLGEVQLVGSSANAYIAKSDGVVGTMNVLKGSYGTSNPETVIEEKGLIFWVSAKKKKICQYSANGIDMATYKLTRYFKRYLRNYIESTSSSIDTRNGFSHLPTSIDPESGEFNITCPALIDTPSATLLPSYGGVAPSYATSIIKRFDVYDGLGKTMSLNIEENAWYSWEYAAEWYDYLQYKQYGFKNGRLYQFNADAANFNTFFGAAVPVRICVAADDIPSADLHLKNIVIEGSNAPDFTVIYSDNPNEQISDLIATDYKQIGVSYYADIFRDRLSPNISGTAEQKMMRGDRVEGCPIYVMVEFARNNSLVYVDAINLDARVARGLTQIVQK